MPRYPTCKTTSTFILLHSTIERKKKKRQNLLYGTTHSHLTQQQHSAPPPWLPWHRQPTNVAYLFGWDLVCLGSGSVDVSNDKVLRASGGTVFDQPVYGGPINGLITEITKQCQHPVQYLVADHGATGGGRGGDSAQGNGSSMSSQNVQLVHNSTVVLVLGNEGNGVCTPTPKEIQDPTTITVTTRESTVGSLGVASAGSILMHSLNVTQKHEKKTKKKKEKKHEKKPKKKT